MTSLPNNETLHVLIQIIEPAFGSFSMTLAQALNTYRPDVFVGYHKPNKKVSGSDSTFTLSITKDIEVSRIRNALGSKIALQGTDPLLTLWNILGINILTDTDFILGRITLNTHACYTFAKVKKLSGELTGFGVKFGYASNLFSSIPFNAEKMRFIGLCRTPLNALLEKAKNGEVEPSIQIIPTQNNSNTVTVSKTANETELWSLKFSPYKKGTLPSYRCLMGKDKVRFSFFIFQNKELIAQNQDFYKSIYDSLGNYFFYYQYLFKDKIFPFAGDVGVHVS